VKGSRFIFSLVLIFSIVAPVRAELPIQFRPFQSPHSQETYPNLVAKIKAHIADWKAKKKAPTMQSMETLANMMAEVHLRRKERVKDEGIPSWENSIGEASTFLVGFGPQYPQYLELLFTEAIVRTNGKLTDPCEIVRTVLNNYSKWKSKGLIDGLGQNTPNSWNLPMKAIPALFLAEAHQTFPNEAAGPLKEAITQWASHNWMADLMQGERYLRIETGIHNQFRVWGEVYSVHLIRLLLEREELRKFLPPNLQSEATLRSMKTTLEKSLIKTLSAYQTKATDGFNSYLHTHLIAQALLSVSPEVGSPLTNVIDDFVIKKVGDGSKFALPYTLQYNYWETPRSSSARSVPYYLNLLVKKGASEKTMDDAIQAMEYFALYSGSLISHVPRGDAPLPPKVDSAGRVIPRQFNYSPHAGSDGIAQYYWAPTVPVIANGISLLKKMNLNQEQQRRLSAVESIVNKTISSQMREDGVFVASTQRFGEDVHVWATPLPAMGALIACQDSQGKGNAGIIGRNIPKSVKDAFAETRVPEPPQPLEEEPKENLPEEKVEEKTAHRETPSKTRPQAPPTPAPPPKATPPENGPIQLLTNREYSRFSKEQAQLEWESWRSLLKSDEKSLRRKILEKIFSLSQEQRQAFKVAAVGTAVDAHSPNQAADEKILSLLKDLTSKIHRPDTLGEDWSEAAEQIRAGNREWNSTLSQIVGEDGKVNREKKIKVIREGKSEEITAGEWIDRQVKKMGYDKLIRWAVSHGGESGEKLLTALADWQKNGESGFVWTQPIKPDERLKFGGEGKVPEKSVGGPVVLDLRPQIGEKLRQQMDQLLPRRLDSWDKIQFVPPSEKKDLEKDARILSVPSPRAAPKPSTPAAPKEPAPVPQTHEVLPPAPEIPQVPTPAPGPKTHQVPAPPAPTPKIPHVPAPSPAPAPVPPPVPRLPAEEQKEPVISTRTPPAPQDVGFVCVPVQGGFKPQSTWRTRDGRGYPPLGRDPIQSRADCEKSRAAARNGVVCSNTGLGWKPTHYRGTTDTRPDYGFWGSSIPSLDTCIQTTLGSTYLGVCYWGGNAWFAGHISGQNRVLGGGFSTLGACNAHLKQISPQAPKPIQYETSPGAGPAPHPMFSKYCNSCHDGSGAFRFPNWGMTVEGIQEKIKSSNASESAEAKEWLGRLHDALNIAHSMPADPALKKSFDADKDAQEFSASVADLAKAGKKKTDGRAPNAIQILPPQQVEAYRNLLPSIDNPELGAIFSDPNTLFFDDASLPAAYQDPTGVMGVKPNGHITFVETAPFIDQATGKLKTFGSAAGLSGATKAKTFHFMWLPKDESGNLKKIKVWAGPSAPEDGGPLWQWEFPAGTVSGEVIYEYDSKGQPHVLEVRTRKKERTGGMAQSDIYTPIPTKEDLSRVLTEVKGRRPDLANEIASVSSAIETAKPFAQELIKDNLPHQSFQIKGFTMALPKMSEELTHEILREPFRSSLGKVWTEKEGKKVFAPTTNQPFGVVPQHSTRGVMSVDRKACDACHAFSNVPFRDFFAQYRSSPGWENLLRSTTDAYGNSPGSDGNLRWHPFDPRLLQSFGLSGSGDNRKLRPAFGPILEIRR
jgi:hypothetical protein